MNRSQSNVSLKKRTLKAGSWVLAGHFISQITRLGGNLILTRLLVPEMFGLMAVVSIFLAGIAMFSDLGITQNIIQSKKSNERSYLNTAWSLQVIRGAIIFLLLLLLSTCLYYLGKNGVFVPESVYSDPQLPLLLAVMSITAFISGFNSLNLALQNRDLKLNKIIIIEVSSQIIGLLVMIILAWYQRNIWSLVTGSILSILIKMLMSHDRSLGNKLHFGWDKDAVNEIFHFGKWIFGSSIFTFLSGQGDRLLLGGLISPKDLGIYTVAFFLAMAFKEIVRKVMSSVFYPALSEVARTRPNELKDIYYRIRGRVDLVVMIVVGLLASTGHIVVEFLYDDRYQEAGWILETLSLSTIFLGTTMAGVCLMALGNSRAIMILTATSTLFLFVSVPIAFHFFGLYGAVVLIALNAIVEIPLIFYMMHQYGLLSWTKEFRMWPVFVISYLVGQQLIVPLW